jgi:hypothetical protein
MRQQDRQGPEEANPLAIKTNSQQRSVLTDAGGIAAILSSSGKQ